MVDEAATPPTASAVTPIQAIIILMALLPLLGGLFIVGEMIGVADFLFVGFLFILYWTGIKGMAPNEFVPALIGSLGGLGLAYLVHSLPAHFGLPGAVLVSAALGLSIYLFIRQRASIVINYAFMLILTVATSVAFTADQHYAAAASSIILAGVYTGAIALIGRAISSRSGKAKAKFRHE